MTLQYQNKYYAEIVENSNSVKTDSECSNYLGCSLCSYDVTAHRT